MHSCNKFQHFVYVQFWASIIRLDRLHRAREVNGAFTEAGDPQRHPGLRLIINASVRERARRIQFHFIYVDERPEEARPSPLDIVAPWKQLPGVVIFEEWVHGASEFGIQFSSL